VEKLPGYKDNQDNNQKQRDNTDGNHLVGLLHILNDIVGEIIELSVLHARVTVVTGKFILLLLQSSFETFNTGMVVFRNQRRVLNHVQGFRHGLK